MRKGDYVHALSDLQEAVYTKSEKGGDALNLLAWLRATCPDAKMRNGKEAVELAIQSM